MRFQVNETSCTHCGACVAACPTDMVRDRRGAIKISFVACIGCGHCMAICPEGAISLQEADDQEQFSRRPETRVTPDQLLGLLQSRRTVRRYLPDPLSREDLARLLEAARWVPTGANCQCQQFVVVTDPERLAHLRQEIVAHYRRYAEALAGDGNGATEDSASSRPGEMHAHVLAAVPAFLKNIDAGRDRLFFDAPAVILIHAPRDEVLPESACAFAALAIALMAETLDLGTCITAYASMALQALPDLAREIGVPAANEVYYVLVAGKPAEQYQLIPPRKPAQVTWIE